MTLTPTDMLMIQSAIDRYEKKFPRKPSPSAAEALAWQARKQGTRLLSEESSPIKMGKRGVWSWASGSFRVWWQKWPGQRDIEIEATDAPRSCGRTG
jgi:hypothetical protein